jgi:hypothetical protein
MKQKISVVEALILAALLAVPRAAFATVCDNVASMFQSEFGEWVPKPACPPANSSTAPGTNHLTTTAYLPTGNPGERRLLVMHLTSDGNALQETYDHSTKYQTIQKPIPAGTFKVLTVLVTYPQTIDSSSVTLLQNEQANVNKEHADFASNHGYSAPIVQFIFTNVQIPGNNILDPHTITGVRDALGKWQQTKNLNTSDFDFIVVLNINPSLSEGGKSYPGSPAPYFVYMGNFNNWTTILKTTDFFSIARAAYHHEVGHYWGWQHDWISDSPDPFITAPILFGWLDTDGDGIPEILDPCPYGRICPPPNVLNQAAIDPLAIILPREVYVKWVEGRHPHVPKEPDVAEVEQILGMMTPTQREETLVKARKLGAISQMFEKASLKINEQKQKPRAR